MVIRYDTRCYFRPNVRSKADMSQLNLYRTVALLRVVTLRLYLLSVPR